MAHWPLQGGGRNVTDMAYSSSILTTVNVPTAAVAHAEPASTTQLDASTAAEWNGFFVQLAATSTAGADTRRLMQLYIGPNGSETVLVPWFSIGQRAGLEWIYFPIRVPAGVRVSAKHRGTQTSNNRAVGVVGITGQYAPGPGGLFTRAVTYGANTATSSGTLCTANVSTNVFGSWVEFSASTTAPIHAFMVFIGGRDGTTILAHQFDVSIGVGAAASEVAVLDGPWHGTWATSESYDAYVPPYVPIGVNIPAGSRLVARVRSNTASSPQTFPTIVGLTR